MANDRNNKSVSGTLSSIIRGFSVTVLFKSWGKKTATRHEARSNGWDFDTGHIMKH